MHLVVLTSLLSSASPEPCANVIGDRNKPFIGDFFAVVAADALVCVTHDVQGSRLILHFIGSGSEGVTQCVEPPIQR